jgi:serine O-acetyltransferase
MILSKKYYYDLYRYNNRRGLFQLLLYSVRSAGFRYTLYLRLYEKSRIKVLYRLLLWRCGVRHGIQIGCNNAKIGKGFYLGHHGFGVIINNAAIIGENCNIAQGVTIGQISIGHKKGCPTIGNKVWIGANAVVVGKITIGDNVLIAPLSYVNFDIPDNSLVIGNPAKIISKQNATEGYINNILSEE